MHQLKPISKESVPAALEKAERYRLLGEPRLAESICLDVLDIDPDNDKAITVLLLAITDQFGSSASADIDQALQLVPRLESEYERYYYEGLINERQGKALLQRGVTGGHFAAYEWINAAMNCYQKAEGIRPAGNDDSILRWNTCVRLIHRYDLKPHQEEFAEPPLE